MANTRALRAGPASGCITLIINDIRLLQGYLSCKGVASTTAVAVIAGIIAVNSMHVYVHNCGSLVELPTGTCL
jgi:hypothetical protein